MAHIRPVFADVLDMVQAKVAGMYMHAHGTCKTYAGDETPDQLLKREELEKKMAWLICEQVMNDFEIKSGDLEKDFNSVIRPKWMKYQSLSFYTAEAPTEEGNFYALYILDGISHEIENDVEAIAEYYNYFNREDAESDIEFLKEKLQINIRDLHTE